MEQDYFQNKAKDFNPKEFKFLIPRTVELIKVAHKIKAAQEAQEPDEQQKALIKKTPTAAIILLGRCTFRELKEITWNSSAQCAAQILFSFIEVLQLFLEHSEAISRVVKRYESENEFGQPDNKLLIKKLNGFIADNIGYRHEPQHYSNYLILLSKYFASNAAGISQESIKRDRNDGTEFEKECYALLTNNGYEVTETPKTGDYGADLIATKDSIKFVIQCKDFQTPVGVAAVQQAHSSKEYFTADFAVVVTNSKYTPAALKMSSKLNVMCISKNKLAKICDICVEFID